MCDFGTAAWPQMMQTPTKKKFLKVVFIQRKLYLVTLAVLTLEFQKVKKTYSFSLFAAVTKEKKKGGEWGSKK